MRWQYEIQPRLLVAMERHLRLATQRAKESRTETLFQSAHNDLIALESLTDHLAELKASGIDPADSPEATLHRSFEGAITHVSFASKPFTAFYHRNVTARTANMVIFDRDLDSIPCLEDAEYMAGIL